MLTKSGKRSSSSERMLLLRSGSRLPRRAQGHEPGSLASDRHVRERAAELEQAGRFTILNPSAAEGSPGRSSRNAPVLVTNEQLPAIAAKPVKKSKVVQKPAAKSKAAQKKEGAAAAAAPFFNEFKQRLTVQTAKYFRPFCDLCQI